MGNDIQESKTKAPAVRPSLPAKIQEQVPVAINAIRDLELTKGLPPASIVYGVAAGAFFTFAIVLLFKHDWLDGILTMLPAACFVGFAVHILRHADPKR